jgi:hypothetical protein
MGKMDRREAQAQGVKVYESYRDCTAGHIPTLRYSASGNCVACHKARYQQSATVVVKVTIPRQQLRVFHETCKAMGWSNDAPFAMPSDNAAPLPEPEVQSPLQHLIDALPPEQRAALPHPTLREHPPLAPLPPHLLHRG